MIGCDNFKSFTRRNFLRIGGTGLCGVNLLNLLAARAGASAGAVEPKAKQLLVVWLAGGPPHTDMFDMKPESPSDYRGEFKPVRSANPDLQVCELMPGLARLANKYTIIRSVTTLNNPGDHAQAPLYWLSGNPRRTTGTDEYPMWGSVVSKLQPGPADLPSFAVVGKIDHHIGNAPGASFLGPAYAPFVFDPLSGKDDISKMLTPQVEIPAFQRQTELLARLDARLRRQDALDPVIAGLDKHQQTAFNMLRSPKLRAALDISKEPPKVVERYLKNEPSKIDYVNDGNTRHFIVARRLIEAGVPVVHFSYGYWDWHGKNFVTGRRRIPQFDAAMTALLEDMDAKGLLKNTIVLALGEMGRAPKCGTKADAGRDHWDYAQFVLAAGGGFKQGCVVGATDKLGERVVDKFYKVESFGATLYHLLGINPETVVQTLTGRPVKLIAEEAPVIKEAIV
jgi:hypothetical protein